MRLIALLVLVALTLPVAHGAGDDATTHVLSYEAPTLAVRAPDGAWTWAPHASAPEPAGPLATRDGRADAGRLLVDVPAGTARVDLMVLDAVMGRTPVRLEWYQADGPLVGDASLCPAKGTSTPLTVPADADVLVLWVHATDAPADAGLLGACPLGEPAGATQGTVRVTLRT